MQIDTGVGVGGTRLAGAGAGDVLARAGGGCRGTGGEQGPESTLSILTLLDGGPAAATDYGRLFDSRFVGLVVLRLAFMPTFR